MTAITRVLVLSAALAACSKPAAAPRTRLTQEQFVAVMVDLGLQPGQQAGVLSKHRTSPDDLRAFVAAYAERPALLGVTFDSIQVRLDRGMLLQP